MNPLCPMAEPDQEGTTCALSAGLARLVLTCNVNRRVEPSGSVNVKGCPPACAWASE